MISKETKRGFTLIELLVVVAIIGMLSSVVLSSLSSARAQAANTTRLATVKQYMTALELYREDFGGYPLTGSSWVCLGSYSDDACWSGGTYYSSSSVLDNALSPYIQLHNGTGDYPYSSYEGMMYYCNSAIGAQCRQYQMLWFLTGEGENCGPRSEELNPGSYTNATYCRAIVDINSEPL